MERKRIAILGGGLGGLAAAFEITSQPGWSDQYEVTVYQKGWRLGGKGASGRGVHDRIEEHGLHCFWGFYDNTFGILRTAYTEIGRTSGPIKSLDDAFKQLNAVWFIDRIEDRWVKYQMGFPHSSEPPGAGPRLTEMSTAELGARFIHQMRELVHAQEADPDAIPGFLGATANLQRALDHLESVWRNWRSSPIGVIAGLAHADVCAVLRGLVEATRAVGIGLEKYAKLESFVDALDGVPDELADRAYKRFILFQALQFGLVLLSGLVHDGLPDTLDGFARFDDETLVAWLQRHGLPITDETIHEFPIVRGLYNASFCFQAGDFARPDLSAGVSLRACLLMGFTYRGAFMWKMQGGMGDIVFAPLYEALVKRGVRFAFFHRAQKLELDARGTTIERIRMDVQATTKDGMPYAPLIDVLGMPSWPAQPEWDQLAGDLRGHDLESDWCAAPVTSRVLERGEHFDEVVLAIPVGALAKLCAELVERSVDWRNMVREVKTNRTQSFQLWLAETEAQTSSQATFRVMTDVFTDPFNSVADMYQTLPRERWPSPVGSVLYFSTAMPDDPDEPPQGTLHGGYQASQDAVVAQKSSAWLARNYHGILPWLGTLDLDDTAVFAGTFHRANVNADQRYTLSVAKSMKYRLEPERSRFDNLFLAGDWTKSQLDLGCAEGATMSGLRAGRAALERLDRRPPSPVGLPAFVEYLGMPVYAPTYQQTDITLCQFVLDASHARLQATVDRYLNVVSHEERFRALGSWVILQTGFIGGNSGAAPTDRFGTGSETSAAFLVPVVRWRGFGPTRTSTVDVGFFAPLVLVDQPLSLVAGREAVGMAKMLASFAPGGPAHLDATTISTQVVDPLGPASRVAERPLLRIERSGAPAHPGDFGDVVRRGIDAAAGTLPAPLRILLARILGRVLSRREVDFFSLRQLRDAADPRRASFQEITRGRMRIRSVAVHSLAAAHRITVEPYASHPIAETLGLARGPLVPRAQLKLHIDAATLDVEPTRERA